MFSQPVHAAAGGIGSTSEVYRPQSAPNRGHRKKLFRGHHRPKRAAALDEVYRETQLTRDIVVPPINPHTELEQPEVLSRLPPEPARHTSPAASLIKASSSNNSQGYTPSHRQRGVRVRVDDIRKTFTPATGERFVAADGISLEIPRNTLTALIGPSGSGKTTLLRIICGLEQPSSGRVLFDDTDVTDVDVKERNIGYVPQSYALFRHLTVAENITFGPRMRRLPIDMDARVRELLELVDLEGYEGRKPRQLSGGQRQRVALARALAPDPQLLLLDEPFGALDPMIRAAVRQGFKEIIQRVGITSIVVTHDQEEAFDLADQVIIFNKGRIEQAGTPEEVQRSPASPFVLDFIDDVNHSPANCVFVRRMGFRPEGKRHVMTRPTCFDIFTSQPSSPPTAAATITDVIDVGFVVKYTMRFDDGVLIEVHEKGEEARGDNIMSLMQRVYLHHPPAEMMAFEYSELGARPE